MLSATVLDLFLQIFAKSSFFVSKVVLPFVLPCSIREVSLYEEADDGIGCDEDGVLTWDLPKVPKDCRQPQSDYSIFQVDFCNS